MRDDGKMREGRAETRPGKDGKPMCNAGKGRVVRGGVLVSGSAADMCMPVAGKMREGGENERGAGKMRECSVHIQQQAGLVKSRRQG